MKHRSVILGAVLVVATLAAYWPAVRHGGFIWDDDDYVTDNRTLRSADGLKRIWAEPGAVPQYYPLVHTTYWLEYRLWGLNPSGYHIVNVMLHILGALLLWRVLEVLRVPCAWLGAALFALHPVHVESVAWVTERKNVLSAVFYFAAGLCYLRRCRMSEIPSAVERRDAGCVMQDVGRGVGWYLPAVGLFVCALLSKTVTCTLPAALLLVLAWRDEPREFKRHVLLMLPMFALGAVFGAVTIWMERSTVGAIGKEWDISFVERCLIAGRAVWFYAGKLFLPLRLTFIYPRWTIDAAAWWQYLFPVAALGGVVGLWCARRKIGAGPLVAVLFFGGTLLPALGFVNVYPMRYSFVADHFQYLASAGLLALVAGIAGRASAVGCRVSGRGYVVVGSGVVLVVLGVLTWRQCGIYRGVEELWTDTLAKNPACWLAGNNLGVLYTERGDWDRARRHLDRAIELKPDYERSYCNLGSLFERQGLRKQALAAYKKALEIDPDSAQANYNLGALLDELGDTRRAETHYRRALVPGPHLAKVHNNLGNIVVAQGRDAAGLRHYREAIRLDPAYSEPHSNLGILLGRHGEADQAIAHCRKAAELAPDNAEARNNLALMLVRAKRFVEAREEYEAAMRLAPKPIPILHSNLADLNVMERKYDDAQAQYIKALELNPGLTPARLGLARLLTKKVGVSEATIQLRKEILELEEKVAIEPRNLGNQKRLGLLLGVSGRLREAAHNLKIAWAMSPEDAEICNNLGAVFVRMGQLAKARIMLEKAIELKPDYEEARKNLEYVKQKTRRPEDGTMPE